MNELIAEFRVYSSCTSSITISKSPNCYYNMDEFDLLLDQGFVWYKDLIAFNMLTDYQRYWVKIAVSENLEIDPVIAETMYSTDNYANAIVLPFEVQSEERIYIFGDDDNALFFTFQLPVGHYQLLFQNRLFTME